MVVPVISIVGTSGSGKTTLVEKLIGELTRRDFRVGSVKHDAHGFDIDHEGKDSWRHKKAGASTVVLSSPERFAVIKDVDTEAGPEELVATFLTDVDVVVIEGYKSGPFPRIEVVRKAHSTEPVSVGDDLLLAFATDLETLPEGVPCFGLEDFTGLTDLIEERVIKAEPRKTVSLVVDGRYVPLKPFIEDLLREGVLGMIKSLKGCSNAARVEVKIEKR